MEVEAPSNYRPPEKPATYQDIVAYVQEKYGVKVRDAAISIVKRQCGLEVRKYSRTAKKNYYLSCSAEKAEYIKDAFRHFGLLPDDEG